MNKVTIRKKLPENIYLHFPESFPMYLTNFDLFL